MTVPQMKRHFAVVRRRRRAKDLFLRTWWIQCWLCGLDDGPWWDRRLVVEAMDQLRRGRYAGPCPGAP